MKKEPVIVKMEDGSQIWQNRFDRFEAKVYLPKCELLTEVINYGFMTPYLLIFEEKKHTFAEAKRFADESGLSAIAAGYGGSVVFIFPTNDGGWENAPEDLFSAVIEETRISQYYKDGIAQMRNRFTGEWGEVYIRGAVHRSYLYGFGTSADYIAKNCLKTIEGEGLYGHGDITPVVCILQNLSVSPNPQRRDIPVISIGNSKEMNEVLQANLDDVLIKDVAEYEDDFKTFIKKYCRMVGTLEIETDPREIGMIVEPDYCVVPVSPDNCGDDKDRKEHNIGFVAYYNRGRMEKEEKVPLVMCFHGGGDSAMCMVALSEWFQVAAKGDFLLVSVENHMNSTATEAMAVIEYLKEKYPVDTERIYSTGFSMGGCKTWDIFQEYPQVFAAVAPMDATFEVGQNVYGKPVEVINQNVILPVFYVGGEETPLPELPFQEARCMNRMAYVLKVNKAQNPYAVTYEEKEHWTNPIWGVDGDVICKSEDKKTGSVLTMHLFESENGCCYSIFASASKQKHEMRHLNGENAWKFLRQFRRLPNGEISGGKMDEVVRLYER